MFVSRIARVVQLKRSSVATHSPRADVGSRLDTPPRDTPAMARSSSSPRTRAPRLRGGAVAPWVSLPEAARLLGANRYKVMHLALVGALEADTTRYKSVLISRAS